MHIPQWISYNGTNVPMLFENQIHIWGARLNPPQKAIEKLKSILSPDEVKRANQFIFERDQYRFITARGTLRVVLSLYTKIRARDLTFSYHQNGKPFLSNESEIQFNLSHSSDVALYGINLRRPIGIDIERIRAISEMETIAKQFFSPEENEILLTSPNKEEEFFKIWTRNEARIKGAGEGIGTQSTFKSEWALLSFIPAEGFAAALAIKKSAPSFEDADVNDLSMDSAIRFFHLIDVSAFLSRAESSL